MALAGALGRWGAARGRVLLRRMQKASRADGVALLSLHAVVATRGAGVLQRPAAVDHAPLPPRASAAQPAPALRAGQAGTLAPLRLPSSPGLGPSSRVPARLQGAAVQPQGHELAACSARRRPGSTLPRRPQPGRPPRSRSSQQGRPAPEQRRRRKQRAGAVLCGRPRGLPTADHAPAAAAAGSGFACRCTGKDQQRDGQCFSNGCGRMVPDGASSKLTPRQLGSAATAAGARRPSSGSRLGWI